MCSPDIEELLKQSSQSTAYAFCAHCVHFICEKKLGINEFYFGGYTQFHQMLRRFVCDRYSSTAVYRGIQNEDVCRRAWNNCGDYKYLAWLASNVAANNGMSRHDQAAWIEARGMAEINAAQAAFEGRES